MIFLLIRAHENICSWRHDELLMRHHLPVVDALHDPVGTDEYNVGVCFQRLKENHVRFKGQL